MKKAYFIIILSLIIGGTVLVTTAKDKYFGCVVQEVRLSSITNRNMLFSEVWYRNECYTYWRDEIGLCDRMQEAEQKLKSIKDEYKKATLSN